MHHWWSKLLEFTSPSHDFVLKWITVSIFLAICTSVFHFHKNWEYEGGFESIILKFVLVLHPCKSEMLIFLLC